MSSDEPYYPMKTPEIPRSLRKKGIVSCSHNLKPGEYVNISKAFTNVFRPELEAKFLVPKKKK